MSKIAFDLEPNVALPKEAKDAVAAGHTVRLVFAPNVPPCWEIVSPSGTVTSFRGAYSEIASVSVGGKAGFVEKLKQKAAKRLPLEGEAKEHEIKEDLENPPVDFLEWKRAYIAYALGQPTSTAVRRAVMSGSQWNKFCSDSGLDAKTGKPLSPEARAALAENRPAQGRPRGGGRGGRGGRGRGR